LDDAQLLLGKLLRDELHDLPGAIAALRRLPKDYPASILRDDALYELALTFEAGHDHAAACATLGELARSFPDSKYVARGKDLACR
ncbi:MAG TPA: tetratricopeptide repeat protein, partial [Kofleriaceae bacterium]|nr:tetratricopeptide repeat protein [Kofleriaceae bacterium]